MKIRATDPSLWVTVVPWRIGSMIFVVHAVTMDVSFQLISDDFPVWSASKNQAKSGESVLQIHVFAP